MYSIPEQTPFAAGITAHEMIAQLDSGEYVAVHVDGSVTFAGNPAIIASARVVDADGFDALDAQGVPIRSSFSHSSNHTEVAMLGGIDALRKLVVLAVLGESTAPLWADPIHATVLEHASIRTNIASAAHAGPVANLASIM